MSNSGQGDHDQFWSLRGIQSGVHDGALWRHIALLIVPLFHLNFESAFEHSWLEIYEVFDFLSLIFA